MYIRFVVGSDGQSPREMHGPFTEVEYLREQGLLAPYEEDIVSDIFAKFNQKVTLPTLVIESLARRCHFLVQGDCTVLCV